MRLIHLSDLHIGKRVNEVSMLEDQEYVLRQILQIIDAEKADAVLIAGDVYDKSIPPAEAVTLFDDFCVGWPSEICRFSSSAATMTVRSDWLLAIDFWNTAAYIFHLYTAGR